MSTTLSPSSPNVLLLNHAGCRNRGCEALLRSVVSYIREHEPGAHFRVLSNSVAADERDLADLAPIEFVALMPKRGSIRDLAARGAARMGAHRIAAGLRHQHLQPHMRGVQAAIEISGDGVSMHYGGPWSPLEQLAMASAAGLQVAINGGSIGPFDAGAPRKRAVEVLEKIGVICARETRTLRYLQDDLGLRNVRLVADAAFLMKPRKPPNFALPSGAPLIGIGLSHGFPGYVKMPRADFVAGAARMIRTILDRTSANIVLVPHVFIREPATDDFSMSQDASANVGMPDRCIMLPHRDFGAQELKYIVGQLDFFAGARTHTTIAGLSQGVPTMTFTYSVKSWGIFEDFYGNTDFVLEPQTIVDGRAADRIIAAYERREEIRERMKTLLPPILDRAHANGQALLEVVRTSRSRGR
jgi:polysaccharide pyruvyl transferase WcaK-like protein